MSRPVLITVVSRDRVVMKVASLHVPESIASKLDGAMFKWGYFNLPDQSISKTNLDPVTRVARTLGLCDLDRTEDCLWAYGMALRAEFGKKGSMLVVADKVCVYPGPNSQVVTPRAINTFFNQSFFPLRKDGKCKNTIIVELYE